MQAAIDRLGMALALTCAAHCLLVPALFALLPGLLLALHSFQEPLRPLAIGLLRLQALEAWLAGAAIGWAALALGLGWWRHRQRLPLVLGLSGTAFLLLALARLLPGRWLHAAVLAVGGVLLAAAHWRNLRSARAVRGLGGRGPAGGGPGLQRGSGTEA